MRYSNIRFCLIGLLVVFLALGVFSKVNAQDGIAEVGVFEPLEVSPDSTIQVPVSIRNVNELYGIDITMQFDSEILEVVDMNTAMDGIQVGLGQFLDPGLLLFNNADNEDGSIRFTMSQYNPSEPKSGEGILLIITFKGIGEGQSPLKISSVLLSTGEGVEIPSTGIDSILTVKQDALIQDSTYEVANEEGLLLIPTITPTPIPTSVPTQLATQAIENVPEPTKAASSTIIPGDNASQDGNKGYFLVNNWWIVLLLLIGVIGAGVFFYLKSTSNRKE